MVETVIIGVVFALLAAFSYALAFVLIRRRLGESNYFSATSAVTFTGNVILWPLALLFTSFERVSLSGILFFVVAGMLAPGFARLLYNKGMGLLGVSVNASIFSTYPLFSSIFAVLFLQEVTSPKTWIGILAIVIGVILIERSLVKPEAKLENFSKKNLIFPFLAALTNAVSFLVRKYGLNAYNEPLLGVALGYSSAILLQLLVLNLSKMPDVAT